MDIDTTTPIQPTDDTAAAPQPTEEPETAEETEPTTGPDATPMGPTEASTVDVDKSGDEITAEEAVEDMDMPKEDMEPEAAETPAEENF